MPDFLLELFSEEIPARMQGKAGEDLARLFNEAVAAAGLKARKVESFATPRRLVLIAQGLPLETQAVTEERRGPRADAPEQALAGFLKSTGLTRDRLEERDDAKGRFLYAVINRPGRKTADVLAEAIPAIIRAFPWPKSMRWGTASASTASMRWVRPLKSVIALLDGDEVNVTVEGVAAGSTTLGHRFHHPDAVTIGSAQDYAAKLRACHVILDPAERRKIIADKATVLAKLHGLELVPDDGLLAENAGLTEWPVPLLGSFDPAFLDVPPEVIQLTMRVNQKYFALRDPATGKLAPNFICVANIEANDGGKAIVEGNQKVLAARLADARFFWEQDRKTKLADFAGKLDQIVFHEKLGTVADKVDRVAKLARWLVDQEIINPVRPSTSLGTNEEKKKLADMAEQAARLAKADLVTGMVGEFPELQGVMGGYYARAEGLPDEVADAIRDHYKPVGQGDAVPTAPVTVAVSLADKLDTLSAFWAIDEKPTGSKDPFALRRSTLALIGLVFSSKLEMSLLEVFDLLWKPIRQSIARAAAEPLERAAKNLSKLGGASLLPPSGYASVTRKRAGYRSAYNELSFDLFDFFIDRLKVQQREAGVRHDLIDAVFALGGEDDLVRLLARVKALQAFIATEDGANLLVGYRRAANIFEIERKKDAALSPAATSPSSTVTPAKAGAHEHGDAGSDATVFMGSRLRGNDTGEGGYDPEPAEAALVAALDVAEPEAAAAVQAEDFERAMAALSKLRAPIDAFFEQVTVNDARPQVRAARLQLLGRIRDAVHAVADFSKIEG